MNSESRTGNPMDRREFIRKGVQGTLSLVCIYGIGNGAIGYGLNLSLAQAREQALKEKYGLDKFNSDYEHGATVRTARDKVGVDELCTFPAQFIEFPDECSLLNSNSRFNGENQIGLENKYELRAIGGIVQALASFATWAAASLYIDSKLK